MHYYAGTQRIASKVGSGDFYNVYGVNGFHLTAGQKDYEERLVQMEEGVKQFYRQNGIPPGVPTQKGCNADPYVTGIALPNVPLGNYDVPSGWPTNVKFNPPGDVPGPPVQFESDEMGDPGAGYGFESDRTYEGDWFFFHSDHLGSTSYLTDTAGNVSQFVCYTPYGEAIVDEHLTTYENPFKFSGKELDDITGLYYFGARYLEPISARWYSIDRYYEKYEFLSPYSYTGANPINTFDINGDSLWVLNGSEPLRYENGSYYRKDGTIFDGERTEDFDLLSGSIDELSATEEGRNILDNIQNSTNHFLIKTGTTNDFQKNKKGGGVVTITGKSIKLPTVKGMESTSVSIILGHELANAYDHNYGMLDTDLLDGVKKSEYQAVYRENLIRQELRQPLRLYYKKTEVNGFLKGCGPKMLDNNNQNIIPGWYKELLKSKKIR